MIRVDPKRIDVPALLQDHGIRPAPEGHRHYRRGWVNIPCPFCRSKPDRYHLGWDERTGLWNCYRCGAIPPLRVVKAITGAKIERDLRDVLRRYRRAGPPSPWGVLLSQTPSHQVERGGVPRGADAVARENGPIPGPPNFPSKKHRIYLPNFLPNISEPVKFPPGTESVGPKHLEYLRRRGFSDPSKLVEDWGLLGTGRLGPWKNRLILPITCQGTPFSYQARDITGRSKIRYKTCPKNKEIFSPRLWLYGLDQAMAVGRTSIIVVEGPVDAWKLGAGNAVATLGINWSHRQARLLASLFTQVYILFDFTNSPNSRERQQATLLAGTIQELGGKASIVSIPDTSGDPGDLDESQAKRILHALCM